MSGQQTVILVIEDDPDVSEGLVELLEDAGYRAIAAHDGEEGLKKMRAQPGVALILLDLTMPKMSAAEFRQRQRADAAVAQVPVLLMSAGRDLAAHAAALGAIDSLAKPFRPSLLVEKLDALFGRRAAAAEHATPGA
jgi:DNA-binding response OmpR family regulator